MKLAWRRWQGSATLSYASTPIRSAKFNWCREGEINEKILQAFNFLPSSLRLQFAFYNRVPYFLINALAVGRNYMARRMTFTINYSLRWNFWFPSGRNERSNYDVLLWNKGSSERWTERTKCGFLCFPNDNSPVFARLWTVKISLLLAELSFVKWQKWAACGSLISSN